MNAMERVLTSMRNEEPDRVPVYPILAGATRRLVNASYPDWSQDADICAAAYIKAVKEFELDCVVTLIDLSVECEAWGQEIVYPQDEAARPNFNNLIVQEIEDYAKIKKVDYRQGKRMMMHIEVIKKLVAEFKGEVPIIAFVFGPLGTLSMMRNQQDMYMDLYDDPDAVKEAAKNVNETLKEYSAALCDAGADAIMYDTLFASGSIMSKQMWIEMEGGLMKELSAVNKAKGCLTMTHNCGEKIYFDAQIECYGTDAISFACPPDDCKDFAECKEKYGKKTYLIGCVSPSTTVVGDLNDWAEECKMNIDVMAKGGGFMLASGCEFPANASFDYAYKMVEVAKTYGVYKK